MKKKRLYATLFIQSRLSNLTQVGFTKESHIKGQTTSFYRHCQNYHNLVASVVYHHADSSSRPFSTLLHLWLDEIHAVVRWSEVQHVDRQVSESSTVSRDTYLLYYMITETMWQYQRIFLTSRKDLGMGRWGLENPYGVRILNPLEIIGRSLKHILNIISL